MSTLYIIGVSADNLEDISLKTLRILGEVDFILSQDDRVTAKLLNYYAIKTKVIPYNENSDGDKIGSVIGLLSDGKNLALVLNGGMPGISDSGGKLIQGVIEKFSGGASHEPAVQIEFVPGPSAITASLSISGLTPDRLIFMGFPPDKKGRQAFLQRLLKSDYPAVVYESKAGLEPFLKELNQASRENKSANERGELELKPIDLTLVVVGREFSKMRETVYRGDANRIIEKIKENVNEKKGEFIVIVGK